MAVSRKVDPVNRTTRWRRERASQAFPEEIPHGTPSGFANWKCRCGPCCAARYDYYRVGESPNNGKPWTEEDNRFLRLSELPVREIAKQLGRTYGAVIAQRKKLKSQ